MNVRVCGFLRHTHPVQPFTHNMVCSSLFKHILCRGTQNHLNSCDPRLRPFATIITGPSVLFVEVLILVSMSWAFVTSKFRRDFDLFSEQGLCRDYTRPSAIGCVVLYRRLVICALYKVLSISPPFSYVYFLYFHQEKASGDDPFRRPAVRICFPPLLFTDLLCVG